MALALALGWPAADAAQVSSPGDEASAAVSEDAAGIAVGAEGRLRLFPSGLLYPPYLADPYRPRCGLSYLEVTRVGVADSGAGRGELELGGRFGLLRFHPGGRPERAWQLSAEVGFYGQFDAGESYDNLGWDGIYGLVWSRQRPDGLGWRIGAIHRSSHLGDELVERTGRPRINYTREELVAGLRFPLVGALRGYAEGGWAYHLGNEELLRPGRLQAGLEHVPGTRLWSGRLGWYAALDASALEERDWRPDLTVEVGLLVPSGGRIWRLALSYTDGRVPIGELFTDEERWLGLGLLLDL